jgi:hypothetical protein
MNKQIQGSYTALGTQETRVANRLINILASQKLVDGDLKSINRYIGRYRTSDEKKRRKSGYILYYQEVYPSLRKKHPDKTLGEIAKLVGKQWKAKSDAERAVHNKKAAEM